MTLLEFDLYEDAFKKYELDIVSSTKPSIKNNILNIMHNSLCMHTDLVTENEIISCLECGEIVQKIITHEQEWRCFSATDSRKSADPNRVQQRREETRSIHKDVENMCFSETIVNEADKLYTMVTKGQLFRGDSRKSIIFGCISRAYDNVGMHQIPENLLRIFNLDNKVALKGLRIVNNNLPKTSQSRSVIPTPVDYIRESMNEFRATPAQKDEVVSLYARIKNKSSKLNKARPQSVAAALIFYWITRKKLDISIKEFAKTIKLSEMTILKNAREVAIVLGSPNIF